MPYADPEKQRAAQAKHYREKYQRDQEFRLREKDRKANWLQTEDGKLSNAAASAWAREKARRAKQPVRRKSAG